MTIVVTTAAELAAARTDQTRGAVFTMGALHAGHVELFKRCRDAIGDQGQLIVTIFVNPTQFTNAADLERYPRNLDFDVVTCERAGVDIVFAPAVSEMYPANVTLPKFSAGERGAILEGVSRPGHFDAVATVVHRLISLTDPHVTCFGEKDWQQVAVVRQMVAESGLACTVVSVPTKRDHDGVALSSRNMLLSRQDRAAARVIPAVLGEVERVAATDGAAAAIEAGLAFIQREPAAHVDYLEIRSNDLGATPQSGPARALIAVEIAGVRLIDNCEVQIGSAS